HDRTGASPSPNPLINEGTWREAIAEGKEGHEIEPHAARDDGKDHEQDEIVARKSRCDGHDLVGDRSEAFDENDQGAITRIGFAECLYLAAIAIKRDRPVADAVIESGADEIAQEPAG